MAKNRTPTSILEAKGAFQQNPGRARKAEPKVTEPIGNPPTYLSAEEKKVWREIVKRSPPGVLFESDREAFELLVRLASKKRYHFSAMMVGEMSQFVSLCSRYAMTPADRSKVAVETPKKSALSDFINRKSA